MKRHKPITRAGCASLWVSKETHRAFKQGCAAHGRKLGEVAEQVIQREATRLLAKQPKVAA